VKTTGQKLLFIRKSQLPQSSPMSPSHAHLLPHLLLLFLFPLIPYSGEDFAEKIIRVRGKSNKVTAHEEDPAHDPTNYKRVSFTPFPMSDPAWAIKNFLQPITTYLAWCFTYIRYDGPRCCEAITRVAPELHSCPEKR
jgi:hypothetical protein